MVSLNNILTIGLLGGAALLYFKYGGLSGIGSALGGALSGFGSGVTQGLNRFGNLVETPQSNAQNTAQRVVEQEELGEYVTQVPQEPTKSLSALETGRLTFAGLVESLGIPDTTVNLRTGELKTPYGIQPLDFTISGSGGINTGRVGLSDKTLAAQQELSAKYGIPTFDTAGNLSTFGGLATSQSYANPNFPVRGIDY